MSYIFRCFTLFDLEGAKLTVTRKNIVTDSDPRIQQARQSNFDTILQVISLRSQPEVIDAPKRIPKHPMLFGSNTECWVFTFQVFHQDVFGKNLEYLIQDCSQVPMLTTDAEPKQMFLSASFEPNIYFEEIV